MLGHRDHEAALKEMCETNKGRVAVLWPGDAAIDARDIAREMPLFSAAGDVSGSGSGSGSWGGGEGASGSGNGSTGGGVRDAGSGASSSGGASSRVYGDDDGTASKVAALGSGGGSGDGAGTGAGVGYTFIAVDATWNCARKMIRRLPRDIPHVSVPPEAFNPDYVDVSSTYPAAASAADAAADSAPAAAPVGSLLAPVRRDRPFSRSVSLSLDSTTFTAPTWISSIKTWSLRWWVEM